MTKKLYLEDSTLLEFEAAVFSVNPVDKGYEIILDKTAFYPESGGQLFDTGLIDAHRVLEVFERDDDIVHLVEEWRSAEGALVRGQVDSDRRRNNMKKHTGQHILSRAFIEIANLETVSAHLGESESTIELSSDKITEEQIKNTEIFANRIVMANQPISIQYHSREELQNLPVRKIPDLEGMTYRLIKIGDFDFTACGGTHCQMTGEVGLIKAIGIEKLRGHLRISFLTGFQALEDYDEKHTVLSCLSQKLTCHFSDLGNSIDKLIEQNTFLRKEMANLNKKLMPLEIEKLIGMAEIIDGVRVILFNYNNRDAKELRDLALNLTRDHNAVVLFMAGDRVLVSCSENTGLGANDLAQVLMEDFGGRGGGNAAFAQVGGIPLDKMQEISDNFKSIIADKIGR